MDKFEQVMKDIAQKSDKEKVEMINGLKEKCPCPGCPTYNTCAEKAGEKLFCILGNSFMCISYDRGCACPTCPLKKDVGLKYKEFCLKGSEMAQRYANTIWGASLLKK